MASCSKRRSAAMRPVRAARARSSSIATASWPDGAAAPAVQIDRTELRRAYRADEEAVVAERHRPGTARPRRALGEATATARALVKGVRGAQAVRPRRLPAGLRPRQRRGHCDDVPRRGAAAHSRRAYRRRADRRQTVRPRLGGETRPVRFGLRQCRDLLAAADRQGARRRAATARDNWQRRAGPRRRPAGRAGGPDRGPRGDEDPRPQFRVRPDDRRSAAARRARARRRASATASTCSAKRRARIADAERYAKAYRDALDRIAEEAKGGFAKSPGISVKLSALHPRYEWSHADEAKADILPILRELALKASKADVHLTIDAEEADRLELPDGHARGAARRRQPVRERLGRASGIAIQAYQKRALPLCDWTVAAARAHRPQADGPAGQGRLLGHRDQGRAGRGPAGLSGVHAQGRDRRVLSRLRQDPARGDATPSTRRSRPTTRTPSRR